MTPRKSDYDDDYDDDELEFIEEYSEDELAELYEMLGDFPEFEEYFDDILSFDDEDFYSTTEGS
jgi:hypothetical protein